MRRQLFLIVGIAIVVIVGLDLSAAFVFVLTSRSGESGAETVTVSRGTVRGTVNGSGFLVPSQQANLNFQRSGRIAEITVKVGDRVKTNQLLARIEGTAEDSSAGQLSLVAPFDGIVVAINGQVGDIAGSGTISHAAGSRAALPSSMLPGSSVPTSGLIVLNADGALQAVVSFAEVDVVRLKTDQMATLTFDAIPGLTLNGHLIGISPTGLIAANNVVKYHATLALEGNDARLRPPMSVNASTVVAEARDVLKLPSSAVRQAGGKNFVTMYSNGRRSEQEVTIGLVGETDTEIKDGLKEGDRVLLTAEAPTRPSSTPVEFP